METNVPAICRLCLYQFHNSSQRFALDSCESNANEPSIMNKLRYCLSELDIRMVPNATLCRDCLGNIKVMYRFTVKYHESQKHIKDALKIINYGPVPVPVNIKPEEMGASSQADYESVRMCIVCFKIFDVTLEPFSYIKDSDGNEPPIKNKFYLCFPECNINIVPNAVLCKSCLYTLNNIYLFKIQCLQINEHIMEYFNNIKWVVPLTDYIKTPYPISSCSTSCSTSFQQEFEDEWVVPFFDARNAYPTASCSSSSQATFIKRNWTVSSTTVDNLYPIASCSSFQQDFKEKQEKSFIKMLLEDIDHSRYCRICLTAIEGASPYFPLNFVSSNANQISIQEKLHLCLPELFEEDMENYIKHKLMGGLIILKSHVVPHIFECQLDRKRAASALQCSLPLKRQCKQFVEEAQQEVSTANKTEITSKH